MGLTAVALVGFSCCTSFWMLCLWAVPYGLGSGSVDASLNNYVALHYASRHMSWLHCMWGIGASVGPYIMGGILAMGLQWNLGYRTIGLLQIILTAVLFLSLPLWKKRIAEGNGQPLSMQLNLAQIIRIPGAKESMVMFFCYCALEQTAGLWASAYIGTFLMPPLFGLVAEHIDVALLPAYLLAILAMMTLMHERLLKKTVQPPLPYGYRTADA